MESHELRIFRAVAIEGSITKAAQVLGYVQSNVTARVQQLESELNTQLFYRQRGMLLTPAGEKLLGYVERILHLLDEADKALNDSIEPRGRLSIGANYTVSALYLPNILAEYHKIYPNVELSLMSDHSDQLLQKVRHFQLDAAFVKSPSKDENIVEELIYEEELVLITGSGNQNIYSACSQPFLMNTIGCPHREQLELWLKSIGISSVRYMEFNNLDAIIRGVMAGLGASFVPKSAIQKHVAEGKLQTFSIPNEYNRTKCYLIRHKDSLITSGLEKFIVMVKSRPLVNN